MKVIIKNGSLNIQRKIGLTLSSETQRYAVSQVDGSFFSVPYGSQYYYTDVYTITAGMVIEISGEGYYNKDKAIFALYSDTPSSSTVVSIEPSGITTTAEARMSFKKAIIVPDGVQYLAITRYENSSQTVNIPWEKSVLPVLINN